MPTHEIPRSQWREFFDSFSRDHEGWTTSIEVTGTDVPGDQIEADELPLEGISADTKGSEPDAIEITVGRDPADQVTHIVHDASRVRFEQMEAGMHEGLEIGSATGERTILSFRMAAQRELPEGKKRRAGGR